MKNWMKGVLGIVAIVIIVLAGTILFNKIGLQQLNDMVLSFGIFAPIAFIIVMALAIIISPIPSLPLDIWGGSVFGGFWGGVYAVVGAEIGAIIAFLIARKFGRIWLENTKGMQLCDTCYEDKLHWIIFLTRLLPIFQFDIISYAAGITNIKFWKFAVATFFGMIPVTFMLSYTGKAIIIGNIWINVILSLGVIVVMYKLPKILIKYFNIKIQVKS